MKEAMVVEDSVVNKAATMTAARLATPAVVSVLHELYLL
jgi:hypothetical protein